jgi:hypothetical protein
MADRGAVPETTDVTTLTIKQAMEQAVASCKTQWESPDGSALLGNFENARVVGYLIPAKEWENTRLGVSRSGGR